MPSRETPASTMKSRVISKKAPSSFVCTEAWMCATQRTSHPSGLRVSNSSVTGLVLGVVTSSREAVVGRVVCSRPERSTCLPPRPGARTRSAHRLLTAQRHACAHRMSDQAVLGVDHVAFDEPDRPASLAHAPARHHAPLPDRLEEIDLNLERG